jgi:hypothetical protein
MECCCSVVYSSSTVAVLVTEHAHAPEAGLCCYLVIHIGNLLRPLQAFYFRLCPVYWLSLESLNFYTCIFLVQFIQNLGRYMDHVSISWLFIIIDLLLHLAGSDGRTEITISLNTHAVYVYLQRQRISLQYRLKLRYPWWSFIAATLWPSSVLLSVIHIRQNYSGFGLCLSSGILKIRNHNVSETGSVSILRWGVGDIYSVGFFRKS